MYSSCKKALFLRDLNLNRGTIWRFKLGDRHKGERAIIEELQVTWGFFFWLILSVWHDAYIINSLVPQESGDQMI